jgi:hypothetical protein
MPDLEADFETGKGFQAMAIAPAGGQCKSKKLEMLMISHI